MGAFSYGALGKIIVAGLVVHIHIIGWVEILAISRLLVELGVFFQSLEIQKIFWRSPRSLVIYQ